MTAPAPEVEKLAREIADEMDKHGWIGPDPHATEVWGAVLPLLRQFVEERDARLKAIKGLWCKDHEQVDGCGFIPIEGALHRERRRAEKAEALATDLQAEVERLNELADTFSRDEVAALTRCADLRALIRFADLRAEREGLIADRAQWINDLEKCWHERGKAELAVRDLQRQLDEARGLLERVHSCATLEPDGTCRGCPVSAFLAAPAEAPAAPAPEPQMCKQCSHDHKGLKRCGECACVVFVVFAEAPAPPLAVPAKEAACGKGVPWDDTRCAYVRGHLGPCYFVAPAPECETCALAVRVGGTCVKHAPARKDEGGLWICDVCDEPHQPPHVYEPGETMQGEIVAGKSVNLPEPTPERHAFVGHSLLDSNHRCHVPAECHALIERSTFCGKPESAPVHFSDAPTTLPVPTVGRFSTGVVPSPGESVHFDKARNHNRHTRSCSLTHAESEGLSGCICRAEPDATDPVHEKACPHGKTRGWCSGCDAPAHREGRS